MSDAAEISLGALDRLIALFRDPEVRAQALRSRAAGRKVAAEGFAEDARLLALGAERATARGDDKTAKRLARKAKAAKRKAERAADASERAAAKAEALAPCPG